MVRFCKMKVQWRRLVTAITCQLFCCTAAIADGLHINILYAEQKIEHPATLSGLHPLPEDRGFQGAILALEDNNETGRFTSDAFELAKVIAPVGESLAVTLQEKAILPNLILVNAPAAELLKIADLPALKNKIIFNVASRDEALREENCRSNMLHTIPSRQMLTDAIAQYLLIKKWTNWLLLPGSTVEDKAYAEALRSSALKFGHTIVAEKPWALEGDMRESAASEIPLITQGQEYDAVLVADEADDFGALIQYNTDLPRIVAGTHGLVAAGWSDVVEPWGAIQLQNRFAKQAHRGMGEIDFAAWLAIRSVGEAVVRTKSADIKILRDYIMSENLKLSAFKGRGISYRRWNGQLRQPIHLVTKETQIAMAPFDMFLHEFNDLDTLGRDKPETKCDKFPEAKE
jgi:ABC transporter substrate binding protein (PQQ-dependent alcohol dehydrogenase system)